MVSGERGEERMARAELTVRGDHGDPPDDAQADRRAVRGAAMAPAATQEQAVEPASEPVLLSLPGKSSPGVEQGFLRRVARRL